MNYFLLIVIINMMLFVPSSIIFLNEINYFTNSDDNSLLVTVEPNEIYLYQPITIHIENTGTSPIYTKADGVNVGIKYPNGNSIGVIGIPSILNPETTISIERQLPTYDIKNIGITVGKFDVNVIYRLEGKTHAVKDSFKVIDFVKQDFSELVNSGIEPTWIRYDYVMCEQSPWLEEYTLVVWRLKERIDTYMAKSFFEKNNVHVYDMKTIETDYDNSSKSINEKSCGELRGESAYFLIQKKFLDEALELGRFLHVEYQPW